MGREMLNYGPNCNQLQNTTTEESFHRNGYHSWAMGYHPHGNIKKRTFQPSVKAANQGANGQPREAQILELGTQNGETKVGGKSVSI